MSEKNSPTKDYVQLFTVDAAWLEQLNTSLKLVIDELNQGYCVIGENPSVKQLNATEIALLRAIEMAALRDIPKATPALP